jgi:hypothetical protein
LRVLRYDSIEAIGPQLERMAGNGSAAAMFAPYLVGVEGAFARSGIGSKLPVLLPMAMRGLGTESRVLFALPDLHAQARALIASPVSTPHNRLTIAIEPALANHGDLAKALQQAAMAAGWRTRIVASWQEAMAGEGSDAVLALAPIEPQAPAASALQLWVPAEFVVPAALDAWSRAGAKIRVALPYPPTVGNDPRWIPPAEAWTAIGCELLARLPTLPTEHASVDAWREALVRQPALHLGDWLRIAALSGPPPSPAIVDWAANPPGSTP